MQSWSSTEPAHQRADRWERTPLHAMPELALDTVLVVDDEESIAQLLGELFESAGYRVLLAGNGRAALTLARVFHPSVVLTDVVMPEMDGPEFMQAMRASPRTRDIPIILMSSTRPTTAALCEAPFIAKPFDIDRVLAYVDRFANHRTGEAPTREGTLTH